jgi:mannose-6-phosphate isomerase-like protein (cupin superfamily)
MHYGWGRIISSRRHPRADRKYSLRIRSDGAAGWWSAHPHPDATRGTFFVLEGEISFCLDGRVIHRTADGTAFVPRGMPHCFKNCSEQRARVLIAFTPGDIQVFCDYGKALANGSAPPDEVLMERIATLGPVYGVELLGPSPL